MDNCVTQVWSWWEVLDWKKSLAIPKKTGTQCFREEEETADVTFGWSAVNNYTIFLHSICSLSFSAKMKIRVESNLLLLLAMFQKDSVKRFIVPGSSFAIQVFFFYSFYKQREQRLTFDYSLSTSGTQLISGVCSEIHEPLEMRRCQFNQFYLCSSCFGQSKCEKRQHM